MIKVDREVMMQFLKALGGLCDVLKVTVEKHACSNMTANVVRKHFYLYLSLQLRVISFSDKLMLLWQPLPSKYNIL